MRSNVIWDRRGSCITDKRELRRKLANWLPEMATKEMNKKRESEDYQSETEKTEKERDIYSFNCTISLYKLTKTSWRSTILKTEIQNTIFHWIIVFFLAFDFF